MTPEEAAAADVGHVPKSIPPRWQRRSGVTKRNGHRRPREGGTRLVLSSPAQGSQPSETMRGQAWLCAGPPGVGRGKRVQ